MAKRFQQQSSSFHTVFRAGSQRRFTLSGVIVWSVKLLLQTADKLQVEVHRCFSDGGLGQRAAAPRHGHAIIKTLITAFLFFFSRLTNNLTERGEAGPRHLLLASEASNQSSGQRWRAGQFKVSLTNRAEGQVGGRNR